MSERHLSQNEFRELVPHLKVEQLLLTQVFVQGNWENMFNVINRSNKRLEPDAIYCKICDMELSVESFRDHLIQKEHIGNLDSNEGFYHPIYTTSKRSPQLGEPLKIWSYEESKQVAKFIELNSSKDFEAKLISLILNTEALQPQDIHVKISLTLLELLKIEFSVKAGEWKPMLTIDGRPHTNGRFRCCICSRYCSGVISLNDHLNGMSHKLAQVKVLGMRLRTRSQLTKNCCISYDEVYSLFISKKGKTIFENKIKAEEKAIQKQNLPKLSEEIASRAKKLYEDYAEKNGFGNKNKNKNVSKLTGNSNEPLIGVEYVVKIIENSNDKEIMYECVLCEIMLNEGRMQVHLTSYNHRLKYCGLHYADTVKKLQDDIGHLKYFDYFCVMGEVLKKLAGAIEAHHSRSIPYEVTASEFSKNRADIVVKVYSFRHASQQQGPSFKNLLSRNEIKDIKSNVRTFDPPLKRDYENPIFIQNPERIYLKQKSHNATFLLSKSTNKDEKLPTKGDKETRRGSRTESTSVSSQNSKKRRMRMSDDEAEIWKTYRKEISLAASNIERLYVDYRKNPESHPLYDDEWSRFWKQRKEELVAQGIDYRSHDYQTEWVFYFKNRLEELFGQTLNQSKMQIRKRLNIPLDAEEDSDITARKVSKIDNQPSFHQRSFAERKLTPPQPNFSERKITPQPSFSERKIIPQSNFAEYKITPQPNFPERNIVPQPSFPEPSLAMESNNKRQMSPPNKSATPTKISVNPDFVKTNLGSSYKKDLTTNSEQLNAIHVLRLMTALEDHLGSLGSKILDLLSKALALEKMYQNEPMVLLKKILTYENCSLLELAMEKLRGLLLAGLLDENREKLFKRVIEHTSNLLNYAETMGWRIETVQQQLPETDNKLKDLQKLLEDVMQNNKNPTQPHAHAQKSLSDTLMELITSQKSDSAQNENTILQQQKIPINDRLDPQIVPPPKNHYQSSNIAHVDNYGQTNAFKSRHYTPNSSKTNDLNIYPVGLSNFDTKLNISPASNYNFRGNNIGIDKQPNLINLSDRIGNNFNQNFNRMAKNNINDSAFSNQSINSYNGNKYNNYHH